jgi:hypothetical protein
MREAIFMITGLRTTLLVLVVLALFATFQPGLVSACSGGGLPIPFQQYIDESDYVVRARIAQVDDLGASAIIEVESYLVGGPGPQFLLWRQTQPELIQYVHAGRKSGGDCLGGGMPTAYRNRDLYLFLKREPMGSYIATRTDFRPDWSGNASVTWIYPPDISTFELDHPQQIMIDREHYVRLVGQLSGQRPVPPDRSLPYPLYAPLLLKSEGGQEWLFPVDGNAPVEWSLDDTIQQNGLWFGYGFSEVGECGEFDCQLSSDGLTLVKQANPQTIITNWGREIVGQASLLSSTGDMLAVWQECTLTIYQMYYPRLMFREELAQLNSVDLSPNTDEGCAAFMRQALWSPDGRMLVFTDSAGLWLWDSLLAGIPPQLLTISTPELDPVPVRFSESGRFLTIQDTQGIHNHDLLSGEVLPDGVISPDERLIVVFDSTAINPPGQICSISLVICQDLLTNLTQWGEGDTVINYELRTVNEIFWLRSGEFLTVGCVPEQPEVCGFTVWGATWQPNGSYWMGWPEVARHIAYDRKFDMLARLDENNLLRIGDQIYDLTGKLPAPIIDMEWMPSLMYRY